MFSNSIRETIIFYVTDQFQQILFTTIINNIFQIKQFFQNVQICHMHIAISNTLIMYWLILIYLPSYQI